MTFTYLYYFKFEICDVSLIMATSFMMNQIKVNCLITFDDSAHAKVSVSCCTPQYHILHVLCCLVIFTSSSWFLVFVLVMTNSSRKPPKLPQNASSSKKPTKM